MVLCSEEACFGGAGFERRTVYRSEGAPQGQGPRSITVDVPPLCCMLLESINTDEE